MASKALKRPPDSGVKQAVQSIEKNKNFKRMMIFGLKNLSDFCTPPSIKHKENSLFAFEENSVKLLHDAIKAHPQDEDIQTAVARTLWGMAEAFKDERNTEELFQKFESQGGVDCGLAIFAGGKLDSEILQYIIEFVQTLGECNVAFDAAVTTKGILQNLEPKSKAKAASKMIRVLTQLSAKPDGIAALTATNGADTVLKYCVETKEKAAETPKVVEDALKLLKAVAVAGKSKSSHLDDTMNLMEQHRDNKGVTQMGGEAMAAMVSPEKFRACLAALAQKNVSQEERTSALATLVSMSYISSYAEEVVKHGGVPHLCDAISKAAEQLASSPDARLEKGVAGACKMLSRILDNPTNVEAVVKANGVTAVCTAFKACSEKFPEGAASCLECLAAFARSEDVAKTIVASGTPETAVKVLEGAATNARLSAAAMAFLSALAQHAVAAEALHKCNGETVIANAVARNDAQEYQSHCIMALQKLCPYITDLSGLSKAITVVAASTQKHATDEVLAVSAAKLFESLATINESQKYMSDGSVAQAVMAIMMEHSKNKAAVDSCVNVLEVVATAKDVETALADLEKASMTARSNPQRAFKAMASVSGLAAIAKLHKLFEQKGADEVVRKGLKSWIEASKFDDQQKLIKAATTAYSSLTLGGDAKPLDKQLLSLLQLAQTPALKALVDRQDVQNNSILDILVVLKQLCGRKQIESKESLRAIVDELMKVMRRYTDQRTTQVACIDIMRELVNEQGGEGAKMIVDTGAIKHIIAYAHKVVIYPDAQVSTLELMLAMVREDPAHIDDLKRAGVMDLLNAANRAHTGKPQVRSRVSNLFSILVPQDHLEREIKESLIAANRAMDAGDTAAVLVALQSLNQCTSGPVGARIAARSEFGSVIKVVVDKATASTFKGSEVVKIAILAESAMCIKNVASTRTGATEIQNRAGGVATVDKIMAAAAAAKDSDNKTAAISAACWSFRRLNNNDRVSDEACYDNKVHNKVLLMMQGAPEESELLVAGAGVLASMKNPNLGKDKGVESFIKKLVDTIKTSESEEGRRQAVRALGELVRDADDSVVDVVVRLGATKAIIDSMERYPNDYELYRDSVKTLSLLSARRNLRTTIKAESGEAGLSVLIKVVCTNLNANPEDPDTAALALQVLNQATTREDKGLLQAVPILDALTITLAAATSHPLLLEEAGVLLGKLGADEAIKTLMKQIVEQADSQPTGWVRNVENMSNRLAVFIAASTADEAKAFADSKKCVEALNKALNAQPKNVGLAVAVTDVTRRLGDRFYEKPEVAFGAHALIGSPGGKPVTDAGESLTASLCRRIGDRTKHDEIMRNKRFLCTGFRTLAAVAHNPETRKGIVNAAAKYNVIASASELLKVHQNDPDVVAAIVEFLAEIAADPAGADLIAGGMHVNGRKLPPAGACDEISAIIARNKANGLVVAGGLLLLSGLACNATNPPSNLMSPEYLKNLEKYADQTNGGAAAYAVASSRIIGKGGDDAAISAVLASNMMKMNRAYDDPALSADDRSKIVAAMSSMAAIAIAAGHIDDLKRSGAIDTLLGAAAGGVDGAGAAISPDAKLQATRVLQSAADADPDIAVKIIRTTAPLMVAGGAASSFVADPVQAEATLAMLNSAAAHEGNGRLLATVPGFNALMGDLSLQSGTMGLTGAAIGLSAAAIKQKVADDQPESLTLEKVYYKWKAKVDANETLELENAATVFQQLDFVVDYTTEYGNTQSQKSTAQLGKELMFGADCFGLLHAYSSNIGQLAEMKTHEVWIPFFKKQKDEDVLQHCVDAVHVFCGHENGKTLIAHCKDSQQSISVVLERGRKQLGADKEGGLINRLELAERTAIDRNHYNGTDLMSVLISLWNDFDAGKQSVLVLRHVFRTMRQIINETWVEIILKNNVPKRLIDVVLKKESNILLLPDVFFLLGTLAVVPQIKNLIGELRGVEACLDNLKRYLKVPMTDSGPVLTNCCLALANITGGHHQNVARFVKDKGLELNIQAMTISMQEGVFYDVANAASVLMCNLCYRRDDLKQEFGQRGAPTSIMQTIQKYDGSDSKVAFRCLASMFKAIANVALFTPNVSEFLRNEVENTFAHFYKNSDNLPDELLETSLRTMSNLVMENTDEYMKQFGVVLEPLLYMLKQGHRTSTKMFSLSFEILGNLSRLEANAQRFVAKDGIKTVLKILNSNSDDKLYAQGIYVLGIQTNTASSIDQLLDNGVFTFLVNVFDKGQEGNLNVECVAALRCTRRILQKKRAAKAFVNVGGVAAAAALASAVVDQAMIHLEVYRVVIALLTLNPPPSSKKAAEVDEFSGDVAIENENWISRLERVERPPSPRSWEIVGLNVDRITAFVQSISLELGESRNNKHQRLQRIGLGVLAYFACEKIPNTSDAFMNTWATMKQALDNLEGDKNVVQMVCYIAVNVLYMSDKQTLKMLRSDKDFNKFRESMEKAIGQMGKKTAKSEVDFCNSIFGLVDLDQGDADEVYAEQALRLWDFPFDLTEWNKDPYPNGVQDLPTIIREEIRAGAKTKSINNTTLDKEVIYWKSSQDMTVFQWKVESGAESKFHGVPIGQIRAIIRGAGTPTLERAKASHGSSCALLGPVTEDFPTGVEINLVFPISFKRDAFVATMSEWRDAAAYGF